MGDGAARHGSALRGAKPCRVMMTHHNKSLLIFYSYRKVSRNTIVVTIWQTMMKNG